MLYVGCHGPIWPLLMSQKVELGSLQAPHGWPEVSGSHPGLRIPCYSCFHFDAVHHTGGPDGDLYQSAEARGCHIRPSLHWR